MESIARKTLFLAVLIFTVCVFMSNDLFAQSSSAENPFPSRNSGRIELPNNMQEMLQKQRSAKLKREHEEMLKRGETALSIASELDEAYAKNESLTPAERKKLEDLEELVEKIRKDLGGDSDGVTDSRLVDDAEEKPASTKDAISFLKNSTVKLFDELKKTSRFTISAIAIQSSNSVIRLARFLRLHK